MSFAFLPWYTGDYLRDTRHLTPQKHGVFLLLLAHCWDQKGPVPLDEQEVAGIANCRSADEIESLRYILNRYFVRMDDGWYNDRMMREVQKASAISNNRAEAGRSGGLARAAKQALKQMPSTCQANDKQVSVTPTPTPTPTTTPKTKTHTRFAAREYLSGKGVDDQTITDYLAIRKDKKLTPTLAALEAIEEEGIKAGKTMPETIRICCANSWAGFKASWLTKAVGDIDYASIGD